MVFDGFPEHDFGAAGDLWVFLLPCDHHEQVDAVLPEPAVVFAAVQASCRFLLGITLGAVPAAVATAQHRLHIRTGGRSPPVTTVRFLLNVP